MRSGTTPAITQPVLSQRERLENIRLSLDLFQRVGGCDPRTELLIKDYIRNVLLEEKLQLALPSRVE